MFKLFKKFFKEDVKLDTPIDKILYLIKHIEEINLYSSEFRNVNDDFLEKDIIAYNSILNFILRNSLETKIISIKLINENSYTYTTYSFWYSKENMILTDKSFLKEWLELSLKFIKWYEYAKKDFNNVNNTVNSRKLGPYYLNIVNIVNSITNVVLKKEV